ncbi:MAG: peptidylprolyl isomerase [Tannerella sp.]|jgi:peptidyl-prolyl cis-trans isomerase SurA|nr:peptidylprolyl isomerase [Tannerella sp.]
MIKKVLILIGLLVVIPAAVLHAQDNIIDEIVWIVGDEAILKSDVEKQRQQMLNERQRFQGDPYCVIPEDIAIQKLYLNQAKLDSIEADEGQVIRFVDSRINTMINELGSQEKLEEYFGKKLSQVKEDFKVQVREQQVVQKVKENLIGDIKLTPSEVRRYFRNISSDSLPTIPTTVEVQIITIEPTISFEETDAIKARLRDFSEQVLKGERDFSTLARLYSEDPSTAMRGGELGLSSKGTLVPEFANVAFNLNDPKRVSPVVETEYGFHIMQLIEKRGDRINVRHILLRPRVSEKELQDATNRMDSLYNDIKAEKVTFDEAATYVSADKDTRNNKGLMVNQNFEGSNVGTPKFEMQELPQEVAKMVDGMQVGEISLPFLMTKEPQQKSVVAIVKLKARTLSHRANLTDDFQALRTIVEDQKKDELLRDWILKKQKSTYVRIAEGWRNCDFQFPGWIKE